MPHPPPRSLLPPLQPLPPQSARRRLLCTALAMPSLAWSASLAAPSEVSQALAAAQLQGQASMRYWGLAIYDARLWALPGFAGETYPQQRFALVLHYARSLMGAAIAQRSVAEMRRQGPFSEAQAAAWQAEMERAFPDVRAGDRITGIHLADNTVRFYFNGQPTSEVKGADFARLFFGIWLSITTSEPAMRRQLLGTTP